MAKEIKHKKITIDDIVKKGTLEQVQTIEKAAKVAEKAIKDFQIAYNNLDDSLKS